VNVKPGADVNSNRNSDDQEDKSDGNEFSSDGESSENDSEKEGSGSERIPERVLDKIRDERDESSSTNQGENNSTNSVMPTGQVPLAQNNGGFDHY
jgi:hypothetical protein